MVYTVITILIVIASLLLIGIVLIQKSKGGGLSENFGKGNDMFGVKQTTDIVEKITWGLVAFVIVLSVVSVAFVGVRGNVTEQSEIQAPPATTLPTNKPNMEGAQPAPQVPASNEAPAQ